MSKKRRKRRPRAATVEASPARPPVSEVPAAPRRPRPRTADERPPAPWGSFPLVELVVLVALVLLVGGFILRGERGAAMIAVGLALGALGGLELSIREHFAGYRSHTLLLSGAPAVAVLAVLAYLVPSVWLPAALAAAAAVFALAASLLTGAFRRRSGQSFKVR
jgi:hypothetical protein